MRTKRIATLFAALVLLLGTVVPVLAVTGLGVNSWLLAGAENPGKTCAELDDAYADVGTTWVEFKLEGADRANGTYTDGTIQVTLSNYGTTIFDWASNIGVDAIVVKDGVDGADFYVYDGLTSPGDGTVGPSGSSTRDSEATSDTGLTTPGGDKEISHISFCYDAEVVDPGTIIVEKQTDPDAATDTFTFTGDAAGSISDGGQIVVGNLLPGTYTSQEAVLAGWDLSAIVCDDDNSSGDVGTRTATFNLEAGETVKCTFENTKEGSITIKKVTHPEGGAGFPFESDTLGPFNLNDGGEITFSALSAGDDHTVTEVVPQGWNLTSIVCSYSSTDTAVGAVRDGEKLAGVTIHLGAGDDVHCTFNNREEPTAITLASFTAEPDAEGVTLTWETAAEIDNAGFNLYRAAAPDGPYVKINSALIAAQGSPASGASYSFADEGLAPGTYTYKLEDVDLNGVTTLHGPFSTTLQPNIRRPSYRPTVPD